MQSNLDTLVPEGLSQSSLLAFLGLCLVAPLLLHRLYLLLTYTPPQNVPYAPPNRYTDCPICLQQIRNRVISTCTHDFCASCIIQYSQSRVGRLVCPLCRQAMVMFFISCDECPDNQDLLSKIREYNTLYANVPRSPLQHITRLSLILLRSLQNLLRDPHGQRYVLALMTTGFHLVWVVVYLLSPFDLIPEAVFGVVGLCDDLLVVVAVLCYMATTYYRRQLHH